MNLTVLALAGAVVFFGRWQKKQTNDAGQLIGLLLAAIFLTLMGKEAPKVASAFTWLIFFGAFALYGDGLVKGISSIPGSGGIAGQAVKK